MTKASNDYIARLGCSFTESDNIRSYGILPAAFETVMLQNVAKHQGSDTTDMMAGFNMFNPTETGDPKHIGKVLLAMFDNTTKYCSGETVVCDGDHTAKAEVFYKQLHNVMNIVVKPKIGMFITKVASAHGSTKMPPMCAATTKETQCSRTRRESCQIIMRGT